MKKIALCLYGNFNNRLSATSGIDGTNYIKETILKNRDVTLFIHSWDLENKNIIQKQYGNLISDSIFESQIDFSPQIQAAQIDEKQFQSPGGQSFRTIANSLSFFYSRGKSIDLMQKHEVKTGQKFDVVISSRFDLGQIDKYNGYQEYKTSEIIFDENNDMSFFYSALFNQLNAGYADMWLYSSSDNMKKVALMYEKAFSYLQTNSDYIKTLTTGWPDSDEVDEFSNEVLKPKEHKSKNLKRYQVFEAHNNHIMHKWFFMDVGLYEKSKFLGQLSTKFCTMTYSHTDYSDIWPVYFEQNKKYSKVMGPQFLLINKKSDGVSSHFQQIFYDDSLKYGERLLSGLAQLKAKGFEICLFEHEDMILYSAVDFAKLKIAINQVFKARHGKPFLNGFDCIRLIKTSQTLSVRTLSYSFIHYMLPISKWLISIQPTIWKIDSFMRVLEKHRENTIWEFEVKAQKTTRKLSLKCGYMHTDGPKNGLHHWDNAIYPYIATAIVKGKWNFSEYKKILPEILKNNRIDSSKRGTV